MQHLPRQQVVLLGGDLVDPQLALTLESSAGQFHPPAGRRQLAALVGNLLAGNHRQQVATLDRLAEVGLHRLHHPGGTRHDMRGAVLVEADFPRQAE